MQAYNSTTGQHVEIPTMYDVEELQDWLRGATEHADITHVAIPQTWYGYGMTLIMQANNEYLEKHYAELLDKPKGCYSTELFVTTETVLANTEDIAGMMLALENDYPLLDDETHSRLEFDTLELYVIESMQDECMTQVMLDAVDQVADWVWAHREEWNDGQTVFIGNDGSTPYMSKVDCARLTDLYLGS